MSNRPLTVQAALDAARARGIDRLDAHVLLAHVLGRPRTWLLAHEDALIDEARAVTWERLAGRRGAGEPLAYLLGEKEFMGLSMQVDARVLIPRPDTEALVSWGLEILGQSTGGSGAVGDDATSSSTHVLDLGTGSGAIAVALAVWARKRSVAVDVHASDASEEALAVARANASAHDVDLDLRSGSWWAPWVGRPFHLVVSNPPYVASGDPHLDGLRHEPRSALVAGPDGLAALREIVAGAHAHLLPGAWLLFEHGWDQAAAVQALLGAARFNSVQTRDDLAGRPRCTGGRYPSG